MQSTPASECGEAPQYLSCALRLSPDTAKQLAMDHTVWQTDSRHANDKMEAALHTDTVAPTGKRGGSRQRTCQLSTVHGPRRLQGSNLSPEVLQD